MRPAGVGDEVRRTLADRGVDITDVQQLGPEGTRGSRFAFFDDLDGNTWAIQELRPAEASVQPG
jgi:hypothetical protein